MEETDSLTDPMLLAEIMEAREELEEAQSEADVDGLREANAGKLPSRLSGDSMEVDSEQRRYKPQ
jgi:molecular chaperone HscB